MAADGRILQGEVAEETDMEDRNIEKLVIGLLQALCDEATGA